MRFFLIIFLLSLILSANKLDIKAGSVERSQTKKMFILTFIDNVSIKRVNDELNASKIVINVDLANQPIRYEASGKVSFLIKTDKNVTYYGVSKRLIFIPKIKEYQLYEDVYLKEVSSSRTLRGEKIILNMLTGNAKISGKENAPVHITFEINKKGTKADLNSSQANSTKQIINIKNSDKNSTNLINSNFKNETNSTNTTISKSTHIIW